MTDETFMRAALAQAEEARRRGEVPVGAVVVADRAVVGEGFNQPISAHDPTAHAEIVALRDAGRRAGNYRLTGATLYVTVEPCLMCVGAMVHARIGRWSSTARRSRRPARSSRTQRAHEHPSLNHRMTVVAGVLADECRRRCSDSSRRGAPVGMRTRSVGRWRRDGRGTVLVTLAAAERYRSGRNGGASKAFVG